MTVQSLSYLGFALGVWLIALPLRSARMRLWLLLVASYLFYATWGLGFLALLVGSSLINFVWGAYLRRRPTGHRLAGGLALNVALLGVFKYVAPITNVLAGHSVLRIALPLGISFWTFQAISYQFDLYREEDIDPSLPEFLLYMAFWPTVLAGPVCRLPEMLPQFREMRRPGWNDLSRGFSRILVGLFMKVVLAQLLGFGFNPGEGVTYGFSVAANGAGGIDVWMLAIGFGFQLFFDFAGYSNIVIGVARMFGLTLRENFDRPFLSTTPSVFWTRWHMSLSSWIRDYVFMPLATWKRERWWRNAALVISMVTFGLWHGATALFILWGLYHGLLLVGHREFEKLQRRRGRGPQSRLAMVTGWSVTFALVSLGWLFFRANSLGEAFSMFKAVLSPGSYLHLSLRPNFYIVTGAVSVGYFLFEGASAALKHSGAIPAVHQARWLLAPAGYAIMVLAVIAWSAVGSIFIYFQF